MDASISMGRWDGYASEVSGRSVPPKKSYHSGGHALKWSTETRDPFKLAGSLSPDAIVTRELVL